MSYALELSFYDIANEREIASVTHVDGAQLLVENSQEKMLLYMYKQRDNFRALTHPGMRYTFRYRGAQINQ